MTDTTERKERTGCGSDTQSTLRLFSTLLALLTTCYIQFIYLSYLLTVSINVFLGFFKRKWLYCLTNLKFQSSHKEAFFLLFKFAWISGLDKELYIDMCLACSDTLVWLIDQRWKIGIEQQLLTTINSFGKLSSNYSMWTCQQL